MRAWTSFCCPRQRSRYTGINRNDGGSDEEYGADGRGNRNVVDDRLLDAATQSGQFNGATSIGRECQDRLRGKRTVLSRSGRAPRGALFFCQAEDGIRFLYVTGVQTCALPI